MQSRHDQAHKGFFELFTCEPETAGVDTGLVPSTTVVHNVSRLWGRDEGALFAVRGRSLTLLNSKLRGCAAGAAVFVFSDLGLRKLEL